MITGDHATTAAIAAELGIEGRAVTGTEFAAMSDEQLLAELPDIGVVARVAPDKIRLVQLLKRGNVAAMTGDGVNDALPSRRRTSAWRWASPAPRSPRRPR